MTQNTSTIATWFVTEDDRAKAQTRFEDKQCLFELNKLFYPSHLSEWFMTLVHFCNYNQQHPVELTKIFAEWSTPQREVMVSYFSTPELVNLSNAVFFYKLYPDKLFNELIHPEKLVSVCIRLGQLHQFIEQLQNQLYTAAKQYGLKPGIDYLFHGDELPQGIMIEVTDEYREIIQQAVKKIKVQCTPENQLHVTIERLHDLARAYKFWFNPNRLIDAVMILQQQLVKEKTCKEQDLELFQQQMMVLYGELTTTECLDLYGYFNNNDSRYLLYTLYSIIHEHPIDWLPVLKQEERHAIDAVFYALSSVMEALRAVLKTRHVTTEPYVYDLGKQEIKAGRRNREAVFRVLAIYSCEFSTRETVDKLFACIEDNY